MADYILSLSYGKDSLACLGAIEKLGLPLTRIVHAEVWATDTIHADLPPMVEFKAKADKIIKERWGIEVEHRRAKKSYEDLFYTAWGEKSRKKGLIYGFPIIGGNACTGQLKTSLLNKITKNAVCYVGISIDEPNRFHNLTETKRSPLVEAGWTEAMCREWCEENDLLSPIYADSTRGGCWFCHNQSIGQLRLLRKNYPEYWALLLKWDNDSPVSFKPDGHTVHDFDARFALEDAGMISPSDKWLWGYLKDTPIQMKLNI
jgi:3'-phosphoadenosine 5'-phosphosulfate sulfotransferase (PAPS reductase)/FAD synthetase